MAVYGKVLWVVKALVVGSIPTNPVKHNLNFFKSGLVYNLGAQISSSDFIGSSHLCCHLCSYGKLSHIDHKSPTNCDIFLIIIYLSVNLDIYFNGQIVWKG